MLTKAGVKKKKFNSCLFCCGEGGVRGLLNEKEQCYEFCSVVAQIANWSGSSDLCITGIEYHGLHVLFSTAEEVF